MKKVLIRVVFVLVSIVFLACSKDDDKTTVEPSIVGTWEFYKSAYFPNGIEQEENYILWSHGCSSKKDYMSFNQTENKEVYFSSQCQMDEYVRTWFLTDNIVSLVNTIENVTVKYQVLQLDEQTLKLKRIATVGNKDGYNAQSEVNSSSAFGPNFLILKRVSQ